MECQRHQKRQIKARVREFKAPAIQDCLVLGVDVSIGCVAVRKALHLLSSLPFSHIEVNDDVVGDILVRENILQRVSREQLIAFVTKEIKPLMRANEILELELDLAIEIATEW